MKIVFKKLYDYWMKFAGLLGRINSVIILTLFFVVVMGVYAVIRKVIVLARLMFLARAPDKNYWISKKVRPATLEELKRQF